MKRSVGDRAFLVKIVNQINPLLDLKDQTQLDGKHGKTPWFAADRGRGVRDPRGKHQTNRDRYTKAREKICELAASALGVQKAVRNSGLARLKIARSIAEQCKLR